MSKQSIPAAIKIHVTQTGFSPVDVQHIKVLPSVVTTYDAALPIGESTASITVEAQSNAINTENGQLSGTISKQELNQVPIFSLNPADLTSEMPGVTRQYSTVQNLGGVGGNGTVKLTVNGARPRANNFMMDGQDMNDVGLGGEAIQPILPDFFSSVTTLLNDPSAEYGRAGGAVINQITQHGTNRFHGSVHEIYTGSGLDAIDGQSRRVKPIPPGGHIPLGPLQHPSIRLHCWRSHPQRQALCLRWRHLAAILRYSSAGKPGRIPRRKRLQHAQEPRRRRQRSGQPVPKLPQ